MLGLPEASCRSSERRSSGRAGSRRRRTSPSSTRTRSRRASAPRAWRPGSSRTVSTWACWSRIPRTRSRRARFTSNARVGAPVIVSRQADLGRLRAVVANSGGSNVGDGRRGLDTALAMAAAEGLGVEPAQVGVASTGVIGIELLRDTVLSGVHAVRRARRRRGRLPRRSSPATRARSAPHSRWSWAPVACASAQAKADDPTTLRDDVLLRPDRRRGHRRDARPAHRRVRQALLRPHLGRPAVDERHRVRASANGLPACAWSPRAPGRAAPRRVPRRARCASWRWRSWPTARAADVGRIVVEVGPTPSSRSPARSPTRRSSRPPSTAATPTSAASCRRPGRPGRPTTRSSPTWRSRAASWSAGDAIGLNAADLRELEQLVAGDEVEYRLTTAGEGGETEVFLDPRP